MRSHPEPGLAAVDPTRATFLLKGPELPLRDLVERAREARDQAKWEPTAAMASIGLRESVSRGDLGLAPDFLNLLGGVAFQRGELDQAASRFEDSFRVATRIGDESRRAAALVNLGLVHNVRGRFDGALKLYRLGRQAYRRAGNGLGEARALHNMGMVLADQKRWRSSARCYDSARRVPGIEGEPLLAGLIALNASEVHLELGNLRAARVACEEATERLTALGARPGIADATLRHGEIYQRMGHRARAREHFVRALQMAEEIDAPLTQAEALRALGRLSEEDSSLEEALGHYGRSLKLFRGLDAPHELADSVLVRIVELMGRQVEAADRFLFGHSSRVAHYSVEVGRQLGFDDDRLKALLAAGYLHDIGKLQIDPAILNKRDSLSREERLEIERHAALSSDHVARLDLPWDIARIIRAHHEDHNGGGYPDRLAGDEIPLEARILHVCDVYDALTTSRAWRGAWTREAALDFIRDRAGRAFDPQIVEAFLASVGRPAATPSAAESPEDLGVPVAEAFAAIPIRRAA